MSSASALDIDDEVLSDLEKKFNRAAAYLATIVAEVDQTTLLTFYALFKQATVGKCNIPKPGLFNLQGKAKWSAWNDLGDMSMDVAMEQYVDKMNQVKSGWDTDEIKAKKSKDQQWVSVSTFQMEVDENPTSVAVGRSGRSNLHFECVKEGNLKQLTKIRGLREYINELDDEGLGLIHWAADRGNDDVLEYLLKMGGDKNLLDSEGQTALHYASSCDHLDCVKLLIRYGADATIKDKSGQTCAEVAENSDIVDLLKL